MEDHPRRDVYIVGATARAYIGNTERREFAPRRLGPFDATPQFRVVKDADDIDREIGNPGDSHHCPLCNEFFGWEAFKAHAPACIEIRAPRRKVWVPANTPGALAVFPEERGGA